MKTSSFTVERNYRIDNSDQYAKARFSQEVTPEKNETTEDAALKAIKQMDNIFRMAYPHVEEHLNFPVVRQVNLNGRNYNGLDANAASENNLQLAKDYQKINKGTIEEQIMDCRTKEELKTFQLIADMNDKLRNAYDNKFIELDKKQKP